MAKRWQLIMIKRIKVIQGVGSFVNYRPTTQVQTNLEFSKNTIIYANNGYGKSTIANIFKSLSENDASRIVQRKSLKGGKPVEIEQEVIVVHNTGESYFKENIWEHSKTSAPKIYVFDQHFISNNLFTQEVEAGHKQKIHVLVIGEEGTSLHKNLVDAKENEKRTNNLFENKKNELDERQKQSGRENYLQIEIAEIEQIKKELENINIQIELKRKSETIHSLTSKSDLVLLTWSFSNIKETYCSSLESVHAEAEKHVKEHLKRHTIDPEKAEPIIREAFGQAKETCPFCGREITDVQYLIDAYRNYFDKAHHQLLEKIDKSKADINAWNLSSDILRLRTKYVEIDSAIEGLKNYSEITDVLQSIDFDGVINEIESAKKQILKSLEQKRINLTFVPPTSEILNLEKQLQSINSWVEEVNQFYKNLTTKFEEYLLKVRDLSMEELTQKQKQISKCLERFSLAEGNWCKEYSAIESSYTSAVADTKSCAQKLSDYSMGIFEEYQKDINKTLKDLGVDFWLDSFSEKVDKKQKQPYADFQLVINGAQVPLQSRGDNPEFQNTLSEGEKNTLSFAFFINWIKRQNNLAETIVIFDDPLSSLDENRKNLTARIIRDITKKIMQTIILTHNKDFLFILNDRLSSPKIISLKKDKATGSNLVSFDLEKEKKSNQHQRIDELEKYLEKDYCSVEDAQEKIRLCMETALQFKYYRHLSGISTFGKMLDELHKLGKLQPDLLRTLRDLNDVSSAPHHGESEKNPLKELTRDELLPDIRKTLEVLEQI